MPTPTHNTMGDLKADDSSGQDISMNSGESHVSETSEHQPQSPPVIGLYGISGSGKTHLLSLLGERLVPQNFKLYEGSDMIGRCLVGGLDTFHRLSDEAKVAVRGRAIDAIKNEGIASQRTSVVTGHLSFWAPAKGDCDMVYTDHDLAAYTHILYLNVPAKTIRERRSNDTRERSSLPVSALSKWQETETAILRGLCYQHGIVLHVINDEAPSVLELAGIIRNINRNPSQQSNDALVCEKVNQFIESRTSQLETVLVMDGDRTLAAEDTGPLF